MPRKSLLVAVLLASGTAWADHPSFPDSPKAQQALAQYDNLELEASLALFIEAAKDEKLAKDQRAMAYIYAGLVAMTLSKNDDAKNYFGLACDLDMKVKFPADEASPKIASALEEVRKAKTPDLSVPVARQPDTLAEEARNEAPASRLPIVLGAGGAVVGVAAIIVVLVIVLKGSGCGGPAGTGCIDVRSSGARP